MKKYRLTIILASLLVLIAILCGYIYYKNTKLADQNKGLEEALKNSSDSLARVQSEQVELQNKLSAEQQKSASYSSQVDQISYKVDTLERLRKTDPELLQKYSKIYFLNENYLPSELTPIDTRYLFDKNKPLQIHDRVWPFLKNLFDAASAEGIKLQAISAYRSFSTQAVLKSGYKTTFGAGTANSFSADQGYSEHQLGTTLDFTTPNVGGSFSGFNKDPAYTWLTSNAYKYGFILSYPSNNSYYVFEPWHWRFVGLDLALKLHNENKHFYDLDQREISTYLLNLFSTTLGAPTQ